MYKILEDIEKTKVQKTKFLVRMLPISVTCKVIIIIIHYQINISNLYIHRQLYHPYQ